MENKTKFYTAATFYGTIVLILAIISNDITAFGIGSLINVYALDKVLS